MRIGLGIGLFVNKATESNVPAAPVNVVQPSLSGTGLVGSNIVCNSGVWTGFPTPTFTFRFRADGITVQNTSSNIYVPVSGDDGKTIDCIVTATNTEGDASEETSNSIIVGTAPVNTIAPTVSPSGTQVTGTLITANVGTWTGTPTITYEYRWTRNGTPISGATNSTYTIQAADDGTTIRVEVRGTNAYGTSAYTESSNSVSATNAVAPVNTVAPVISGTAAVGQTLSSTTGTWTGTPTPTFSYQWRRGATNIGTNSPNYTLVQADAGNTSNITCVVTATNAAGSASATSNTIAQILTVRTNAFLTASAITDSTIRSGLNTFDIGLISNSLDTKMNAVYPFVGGTASTHRWNFMDARDLNAAFRLQFSGSWTHSSNGASPNGANTFADTFLNSSLVLSQNSSHLSYYSRTNSNATELEIGNVNDSSYTNGSLIEIRTAGVTYYRINSGGTYITHSDTDSRAFYIANRTASNVINGWRNNVKAATGTVASTAPVNNNVYIGAVNVGGTFALPSTKQCAFASIGSGLTDTEANTFYTLVQGLQTTLGRQVGVPIVSDPDAQAFLNAAEITNTTQANAVNTLVIGMKAQGLWTRMKAVYPFVGGTASSHRFNLMNPLDTNAAFRLTFNGTITHSSNGIQGNGTNGFVDTNFNTLSNMTQTNSHLSVYVRNNVNSGTPYDMGNAENAFMSVRSTYLITRYSSNTAFIGIADTSYATSIASTDSRGFWIGGTNGSLAQALYRNGVSIASGTATSGIFANNNLYLAAANAAGSAGFYSNKEYCFASIGDGLSNTQASAFYNLVQAFQTSLGRQV